MDWFIERLQHVMPTLDYQDLLKYPDEFKILIDQKLIKYSESLETIPCDLCYEDHFVTPFKNIRGEIVISCFGSRREVKADELKIWKINTPLFITLFLKALGKDQQSPPEIMDGLLWDLGTHEINSNQYHLYFTIKINELEKINYSNFKEQFNTAVFYLGTRHTSPPDYILLIPILDIIKDIKNEGLILDNETLKFYFSNTIPMQKTGVKPSKKDLRNKLNNIIKNGKFGDKEKDFLKYLAKTFEPITIKEIRNELKIKAISKMKVRLNNKLDNTGFYIKMDKGNLARGATYQLKFLL